MFDGNGLGLGVFDANGLGLGVGFYIYFDTLRGRVRASRPGSFQAWFIEVGVMQ